MDFREALNLHQEQIEEYKKALSFVKKVIENYEYELGVTHTSSNHSLQTKEYKCKGCDAYFVSSWPDWKVNFKHKPECRFIALMQLIE